jgi:ABC-type sugar transport system ATPase subunit
MLEIDDISKHYGHTIALSGLTLRAAPGEVTGIAGPNGAGKSTLVKVLAGETRASGGSLVLDGIERSSSDMARLTAVVHQEPQLFPTLTVAENLRVGRESSGIRRPGLDADDESLLRDLEIIEHANLLVGTLPIAAQQRTEIARALALDARIFLFDEPNSALTEKESHELFEQVRALARHGRIVLFVSHRLQELAAISDVVAVVKDGRVTGLISGDRLTENSLARELAVGPASATPGLGAALPASRRERSAGPLEGLTVGSWRDQTGRFTVDEEIRVKPGEIVAALGVEGSGAREFTSAVGGFTPTAPGGVMTWNGRPTRPDRSCGFVPASRQDSVFSNLEVADCLVTRLPPRRIARRSGLLTRGRAQSLASELISEFAIRCSGPDQLVSQLSGGNQQKVVIASAIACQPDVLVIEEPTRGVDLGSRADIYQLLRGFAAGGRSVLLYCTEVTEAFEAADVCVVFSRGRVVGRVEVADVAGITGLVDAVAEMESGVPSQS